ncbi:aspartate/glutamate racemase family protein [Tropicibacter sp. R16_0]|uniref:maleate cis-trans isomerase family protein n=1 Tax=Tropicibacter sp. R16_0 TaxID=2821102 RepID=UPI001AD97BB7|nr:aspartate/glutamate racemase family protein [Tropicibacter sp. R16_0]MBO9448910.1 aspartate/glutamate racemase family protein [Tropicibacter sp. R16_0]
MKLPFDTDAGIGTRANLGVVVLETDETLEQEFAQMMREPGVALYHNRIPMVPEIRPETLQKMAADLPASASLFPSSLQFDVIGYGCTSASTVIGPDGVREAIQSARPEAQVTDPLSAIIAACKALGATQLGFITPYLPEVSAQMRSKLEEAGNTIVSFGSFEESDDRVVARITPKAILSAIDAVTKDAECDAVVISCTNLRCLDIIPQAEVRASVPVISSNQALAWHMLRLSGMTDQRPDFGQLFTRLL